MIIILHTILTKCEATDPLEHIFDAHPKVDRFYSLSNVGGGCGGGLVKPSCEGTFHSIIYCSFFL